jgi:hypothetical protein
MYSFFDPHLKRGGYSSLTSEHCPFKRLSAPLRHVRGFLRLWGSGFPALHAALGAQFKVLFFVLQHFFSSFAAQLTLLSAASVFAEFGYVLADFLHIFWIQNGSVCAHKQAYLSRQDACFHIFDTFENFVAEFLSTNLQVFSLLMMAKEDSTHKCVAIDLRLIVSHQHLVTKLGQPEPQ